MAELEVFCRVSCQKCGWNTGATLVTNETNVPEAVITFAKGCLHQHSFPEPSGELLVSWKPLQLVEH